MTRNVRAFLAGAGAGAVATAVSYLGRVWLGVPMLHEAFNELAVRFIPLPVFSFLIVRLKFAGKHVAFAGTVVGGVLVFGLLALLYARALPRLRPAARGLVAAAVTWAGAEAALWVARVGLIAAPVPGEMMPGPLAVGAVMLIYGITFAVFVSREPAARRPVPPSGEGVSRRELLTRAFVVVAGIAAGSALARALRGATRDALTFAQSLFDRIKGLPPEVTPTDQFYVVSKNFFDPTVDARSWRLEIGGLVDRPYSLSHDDLRALPAVTQFQTLECISNEVGGDLISTAHWKGARLRDVLERAGVRRGVTKVGFRCTDGYSESLVLEDALNPTTLIAYEINGEPLPPKHGFPARLLVPGLFGMKNPKWLTRIEPTDKDVMGYWEQQGWSDEAVVKTMSKFATPARNAVVPMGEVPLGGVAFAGDRGVRDVEVSADGGKSWTKAEIKRPLGKFTWVLWGAIWKPPSAGEYRLVVRARDGNGTMQESRETRTLPDGASGYHTISVRVRA